MLANQMSSMEWHNVQNSSTLINVSERNCYFIKVLREKKLETQTPFFITNTRRCPGLYKKARSVVLRMYVGNLRKYQMTMLEL